MPHFIDSLPTQSTSRREMHGLAFNLMFVGATGIGKTSLINSLFEFDYGDTPDIERDLKNVRLRVKEFKPKNNFVEFKITIIETKGFDNNNCDPIIDSVTNKFNDHLKDGMIVETSKYKDISETRVHCCIYMVSPFGLKPIDILTMKKLHKIVRLIVVIGKSDILTKDERQALKENIMQEIVANGIEIHKSDEHAMPIAVAASNDHINQNGHRQRVRSYPWGDFYIERDSEFSQLRDLVLRNNMLSLIEDTKEIHYGKDREDVLNWFKHRKQLKDENRSLRNKIESEEARNIRLRLNCYDEQKS